MEKYTPVIKSKLERIIENTAMIISSYNTTDSLKSAYNAVNDDWESLDGIIENWKQIQFTNNDFTVNNVTYINQFTESCKTNMRTIKGICEDTLAEINANEKENDFKKDVENNKKSKLNTGHWLTIVTIMITVFGAWIASIYSDTSQKLEIRYTQGKQDARIELTDTLNAQQNTIENLLDSLEKIKLRNAELEKCIKLKKTCK